MLIVGSDCSGMCTELHALDALGVPYHHAFCSEIWEPAIRYIRSNHRAIVMYRDMTDRELETAPSVDLYVCGFVCCPMSGMNQKKRSDDPRRDLMWHAIAYIRAKRPKYFIMENVVGLMHVDKGAVWRSLVDALDTLEGYTWDYRILDPRKHADSPQSRPRVFICGRLGASRLEWPDEVPLTKRAIDLLDPSVRGSDAAPCYKRQLETWGITSSDEGIVEFCAASRQHSPYKNPHPLTPAERSHILHTDIAPCLIKHDPGCYAVHLARHLTADECLTLQGFDPSTVQRPQVTSLQMRQLCGNAMHCGVLATLLSKLLHPEDRSQTESTPRGADQQLPYTRPS